MNNLNLNELFKAVQNTSNPMGLLNAQLGSNPIFRQATQMVQGKSPAQQEQLIKNLCQTKGVDYNQFVAQFNVFRKQ